MSRFLCNWNCYAFLCNWSCYAFCAVEVNMPFGQYLKCIWPSWQCTWAALLKISFYLLLGIAMFMFITALWICRFWVTTGNPLPPVKFMSSGVGNDGCVYTGTCCDGHIIFYNHYLTEWAICLFFPEVVNTSIWPAMHKYMLVFQLTDANIPNTIP